MFEIMSIKDKKDKTDVDCLSENRQRIIYPILEQTTSTSLSYIDAL